MAKIEMLFVDLGGVLLTNGWDHLSRKRAVDYFRLDWEDFEARHAECYNSHETDEITLNDYLNRVVFWKPRSFTLAQFREFAFAQSKPFPEMLSFMHDFKKEHGLRVAAVSNEGRDLAEYRIQNFQLATLIDYFFVSCFVHYQKPDPHIYEMALDVTQVSRDNVIYIDDRPNLIEAGEKLGLRSILHTNLESTKQQLEAAVSMA